MGGRGYHTGPPLVNRHRTLETSLGIRSPPEESPIPHSTPHSAPPDTQPVPQIPLLRERCSPDVGSPDPKRQHHSGRCAVSSADSRAPPPTH